MVIDVSIPRDTRVCDKDRAEMDKYSLLKLFKYAWRLLLNKSNNTTITSVFSETSDYSSHKPRKKWVNKGIDRYNKSIKSCLQTNKEGMYSAETKNNLLFLKNLLDCFYY